MVNKDHQGSATQNGPTEAVSTKTALLLLPAKLKHQQQHPPKPIVELKTLTQHPAITIINNKEISIHVEMCDYLDQPLTDIPTLVDALREYGSIKKLSMKIHAPWPHTESKEWHKYRVNSTKSLFAIINRFNLYKLKVTMSVDTCNFPQMKLAAGIHALRFKKWELYYQVYDEVKEYEDDPIKIFRGSEYDRRLWGVYKKEFLAQA